MDQHIGRLQGYLHFWVFLATDSRRHIAESAGDATRNCVDQGAARPAAGPVAVAAVAVEGTGIAENNLLVGTATATEAVVLVGPSNGDLGSTSSVLTRKERVE